MYLLYNNNVHLSRVINALSAHIIHINLNMIFYTHVEHNSTIVLHKVLYKKQKSTTNTHTHSYTHTHTMTSGNWVLSSDGNTVRRGRFSVWL